MIKQLLFLFLLLYSGMLQVKAQQPVITPATDTANKIVTIENADRLILKKTDSANELLIAAGNVFFRDGDTRFYCDSAIRNKELQTIQAFGHVHIIDSDTINTYSDYLIYHIQEKLAVLEKNVKLTDGKGVLTTQNLDYDTNLKIGNYRNGGKVVSDKTVITSLEATYYAELKDVYFKKDVKLKDPAYDLITDSLLYNTETQLATFITDTYIKDTSNTEIATSAGYYDLKNKVSQLSGRSTVKDKALTVTGDELALDDNSGIFEASGNAIMIDTVQGVTVIANNIKANRQNNTFLATLHPLMILRQGNDSIYVAADTLFSGLLKDAEAAEKELKRTRDSAASILKDSSVLEHVADDTANLKGRITGRDTIVRVGEEIPVSKDTASLKDRITGKDTTAVRAGEEIPVSKDTANLKGEITRKDTTVREEIAISRIGSRIRKRRARKAVQGNKLVLRDSTNPKNIVVRKDTMVRTDTTFGRDTTVRKDITVAKDTTVVMDSTKKIAVLNDTADQRTAIDSNSNKSILEDSVQAAPIDTTSRYFKGFRNVRVFSDSLQAVCDSLFYSGRDSVFQLFHDPVLWANKSQVTGDTIFLYTKNKKPEHLRVIENGMMINKIESDYFNQVKGKTIEVFFKDGSPDYVETIGSPAESVYYIQDEDSSFVGMNTATARIINMYFINKELSRVVFRTEPEGTMFPIKQIPSEKMSLRDFKWLEDRRPKTRFELFEDPEQKEPDPNDTVPAIKEVEPEIKNTIPPLKDAVPKIQDTISAAKRTASEIKDTLSDVKHAASEIKDTLSGVEDTAENKKKILANLQTSCNDESKKHLTKKADQPHPGIYLR